ncbi:MAG: hypothetical protein AB8G77_00920 [Rhodothermales bacterium]
MAAKRYKFIKVEAHGNEVFALFEIGTAGFFGIFGKSRQVHKKEKVCKEIYREACANTHHSKGGYTSSSSKEDARKAFYAIQLYKKEHGIPFDVGDL